MHEELNLNKFKWISYEKKNKYLGINIATEREIERELLTQGNGGRAPLVPERKVTDLLSSLVATRMSTEEQVPYT